MSHFTVLTTTEFPKGLEVSNQPDIECMAFCLAGEQLEPYWRYTRNPAYLTFIDMMKDGRDDYESESVDCVRMPDGRIISCCCLEYDTPFELHDGKVYKRRYGPLHHRKRTAKAKKILPLPSFPLKKLYPSFEEFMERGCNYTQSEETGQYGIYVNTNEEWDWCEIGGRWPLRFMVKNDCPLVIHGTPSFLFKEPPQRGAPEGYQWVAGARKCDIAWGLMRRDAQAHHVEYFYEYEAWFLRGEIPKEERFDYTLKEDGIRSRRGYVYRKGEALEAYLDRMGLSDRYRYPFITFACVDGDGWISMGAMGHSGASSDNKEECVWNKTVDDFIAKQSDDTVLISVDCHM